MHGQRAGIRTSPLLSHCPAGKAVVITWLIWFLLVLSSSWGAWFGGYSLYAARFLGGRLQRVDCFGKALHSSACPHVLPHPGTLSLLTPYTSCSGLAVVLPHLPSRPWALLLAAPVHPHEHWVLHQPHGAPSGAGLGC